MRGRGAGPSAAAAAEHERDADGDDRAGIGPATYTQYEVKSALTGSGPKVRAGFIDAPEIGLPHRPASAM